MEYKIENGEARIPMSELNRLNDLFEDLAKREENLIPKEERIRKEHNTLMSKVDEAIEKNLVCIKKIEGISYSRNPFIKTWESSDYRIISDNKSTEEYKEDLKKDVASKVSKKYENKFFSMNVFQFLKWKKGERLS